MEFAIVLKLPSGEIQQLQMNPPWECGFISLINYYLAFFFFHFFFTTTLLQLGVSCFWQAPNCPCEHDLWLAGCYWVQCSGWVHCTLQQYCTINKLACAVDTLNLLQTNYIYTVPITWAVCSAGYKQAKWYKKQHHLSALVHPFP